MNGTNHNQRPQGAAQKYFTPEEAGIGAIKVPPPKPKVKHQRVNPQRSRYVIRPQDLLSRGYSQRQIGQYLRART